MRSGTGTPRAALGVRRTWDEDQVELRSQILTVAAAALLCGAAPATAQLAPAPTLVPALITTTSALPSTPAVDAYYAARANAPIWFRDAASLAAAKRLPAILERAPLDGLDTGPDLARQVEAALGRTENPPLGAKPATFLAEDKLLSAAWVQYVRALKAPVPGITYGDPALAPKVPTPEYILIDASRAPSLLAHVQAVSAVNPIYAQLRDAAWHAMQAGGGLAPDRRLLTNLERARVLPSSGRYIVVNAATAQLSMYEDGKVADTMKVVVGKPRTPTPMLASTIHYATFNPYWNIPADTTREEVAPIVLKRGISYLRAARYEVASDWTNRATVVPPEDIDWKAVAAGTTEVHLRQLPGPANMMGAIKFGFANDLGIYLHDTPRKELFAKDKRNYSHGCVRVEDAARLGRWLLGHDPVAPSSDPEQFVQLAKGVPVFITYLTADAAAGQLTFTDDVYGRDPKADAGLTDAGIIDVKLATAPTSATTTARPN
jgi:murein L,D-transpeptidase YcbB/YkuD